MSKTARGKNWGSLELCRKAATGGLEGINDASANPLHTLFRSEGDRSARLRDYLSTPMKPAVDPVDAPRAVLTKAEQWLRDVVDACDD